MMRMGYHQDVSKRTTVTLEDDVAGRLEAAVRRTGRPFKDVLNEAVRRGLDEALKPSTAPFKVKAWDMGAIPGLDYDDIAGLLEQIEGPEHR
jgi:ribbon-helix-helix CopG family protein